MNILSLLGFLCVVSADVAARNEADASSGVCSDDSSFVQTGLQMADDELRRVLEIREEDIKDAKEMLGTEKPANEILSLSETANKANASSGERNSALSYGSYVSSLRGSEVSIWIVVGLMIFFILASFPCVGATRKLLDPICFLSCIAIAVLVTIFIFSELDAKEWFSWHPVLMTLAFPCLMTLGRWSYKFGGGAEDKSARLVGHRIIMTLALLVALGGYLCIFMAHIKDRKFFGYDFKNHSWNADKKRTAHAILGYIILLAAIAQGVGGMFKVSQLRLGKQAVSFHGVMGKVVMLGGTVNIALAIAFWNWSTGQKATIIVFLILTFLFANVLPLGSKCPVPSMLKESI